MHSKICTSISSWVERDLATLWHPFSQRSLDPLPISFVRGKGALLFTEKEEAYIDGISSWWVNLHGHAHPLIAEAIYQQCLKLEQVIFTDFTHPPAIELAEKLLSILPGYDKVFYSDNGSTAMECALKMALQYWHNLGSPKKKILSFKHAYHGETFGAMSLSGKCALHAPFWPLCFEVIQIDPPFFGKEEVSLKQCEEVLLTNDCACFVFEPAFQASGGMLSHSIAGLEAICALCRAHGLLLIADEILTGFGRIGPLFVSQHLTSFPDILCLSKGITGGFLPLGATLVQSHVRNAFYSNSREQAFLHSHSYTANPLACAAACASFDLLVSDACSFQRAKIAHSHQKFCETWKGHPNLVRLETAGTILICEFKGKSGYFNEQRDRLNLHFLNEQVLLRPLGSIVYVMPPYCITEEELHLIYTTIEKLLTSVLDLNSS